MLVTRSSLPRMKPNLWRQTLRRLVDRDDVSTPEVLGGMRYGSRPPGARSTSQTPWHVVVVPAERAAARALWSALGGGDDDDDEDRDVGVGLKTTSTTTDHLRLLCSMLTLGQVSPLGPVGRTLLELDRLNRSWWLREDRPGDVDDMDMEVDADVDMVMRVTHRLGGDEDDDNVDVEMKADDVDISQGTPPPGLTLVRDLVQQLLPRMATTTTTTTMTTSTSMKRNTDVSRGATVVTDLEIDLDNLDGSHDVDLDQLLRTPPPSSSLWSVRLGVVRCLEAVATLARRLGPGLDSEGCGGERERSPCTAATATTTTPLSSRRTSAHHGLASLEQHAREDALRLSLATWMDAKAWARQPPEKMAEESGRDRPRPDGRSSTATTTTAPTLTPTRVRRVLQVISMEAQHAPHTQTLTQHTHSHHSTHTPSLNSHPVTHTPSQSNSKVTSMEACRATRRMFDYYLRHGRAVEAYGLLLSTQEVDESNEARDHDDARDHRGLRPGGLTRGRVVDYVQDLVRDSLKEGRWYSLRALPWAGMRSCSNGRER
jgi:hypothetical protein